MPIVAAGAATPFLWCPDCGVMFRPLSISAHVATARSHYHSKSWGKSAASISASHGARITEMLSWLNQRVGFDPAGTFLDIGAGPGLLMQKLTEMLAPAPVALTAIEPAPALADQLAKSFPSARVLPVDFESFDEAAAAIGPFSTIFCFGVDYLFRDYDFALARLKRLSLPGARIMFSRNVFLDMPCFFGGMKIENFAHLVEPNTLISMYMFAEQYVEHIRRHFQVVTGFTTGEIYGPAAEAKAVKLGRRNVAGRHMTLDCIAHVQEVPRKPAPVLLAERSRQRLQDLGAAPIAA